MTRVLENNLKPATHFIEVWRSKRGKHLQDYRPINMECAQHLIYDWLLRSGHKPIAIFKIRMKPQ